MKRLLASLVLILLTAYASAQGADVGLVNLVAGNVTYIPLTGGSRKVDAFMKVRNGDRIDVPAGAQVRVVLFDGARQETWIGPASFRVTKIASEPISGRATDTVTLPAGTSQRIAQVPQLVQIAKLGGIQIRGMTVAQKASVDQQSTLSEARTTYEKMRKDLAADDIAPELFLFASLYEYLLYDDMKVVADEMLRKQPDNEQVKTLRVWVQGRASK